MGSGAVSAWSLPVFRMFVVARSVAWLGNTVTLVALPMLVFQLSGSPALTGLIAAVEALPYLMLGLPAGALVQPITWPIGGIAAG